MSATQQQQPVDTENKMGGSSSEAAYQMQVEGVPVKPDQPAGLMKQDHMCCGGCCDMRRAVIICNLVEIGLLGIAMLGILATANLAANADAMYDDDEVKQAFTEFSSIPLGAVLALQALKMCCAGAGVFGGLKYNWHAAAVAGVMYCVEVIVSLVFFDFGGAIYAGFFAYPHYYFIQEVRQGIMSEENYHNEKQSCCCV